MRHDGGPGTDRLTPLQRVLSGLKRICGMPDYEAYRAHLRERHPDRPVPGEREFYQEFVNARYAGGGSRCC